MAHSLSISTGPRLQRRAAWSFGAGLQALAVLALIVGLVLRFLRFDNPPFDAHSFRQCQTLFTIDDFYWNGIDFFYPKTNYVGNPGVFVLEAPVFQAIAAALYHVFGPHIEVVRALNILCGVGTTAVLYWITARLLDRRTALLATLIYWLASLNILFQRSTLLDPMAVLFALASFHALIVVLRPHPEDESLRCPRTLARFAGFALATCLVAVMKALYLWPSVLLLGWEFARRRFRFEPRIALATGVFFVSGILFLGWNYHCRVANQNGYYHDLKPTSLLGLGKLIDPMFYWQMKARPGEWLGPIGMVLYPVGLWAVWKRRDETEKASTVWLLALIPPSYLFVFPNINLPHNYYQLIITPFLAIVAAMGLGWLASLPVFSSAETEAPRSALLGAGLVALILASPFTYLVWKNFSKATPEVLAFQELCARCLQPRSIGIIFVSEKLNPYHIVDYPLPEFLYGAKLQGFGRPVKDTEQARRFYQELLPYCRDLRYVVFYGISPGWFEAENARIVKRDDGHQFYAFELKPPAQ